MNGESEKIHKGEEKGLKRKYLKSAAPLLNKPLEDQAIH
jgi:hypothetical protein